MQSGIINGSFYSQNRKLVIGLVLAIFILIVSGASGVYSFYKSNEKAAHYYDSLRDLKDIRTMYTTQISTLNDMVQNRWINNTFQKHYYEFSKTSDGIQDKLFNLKIKFIGEEDNLEEKIVQLKLLHKNVSDKYIAVIFETTNFLSSTDSSTAMKEDEAKLFNELEEIATSISNIADKKFGNTAKHFSFMMIAFLLILTTLVIVLTVMVVKAKRKE